MTESALLEYRELQGVLRTIASVLSHRSAWVICNVQCMHACSILCAYRCTHANVGLGFLVGGMINDDTKQANKSTTRILIVRAITAMKTVQYCG